MKTVDQQTIAAIATASGMGGVGVVRVSGPLVAEIARHMLGGTPKPRQASYKTFRSAEGEPIDQGIALYFPGPASFTGENVLELQGHGGPVVMDILLARVLELGARMARPGEFSERAFLNDKLDLAQAEAVADLIEAGSATAARAAIRSLEGEFSERVNALAQAMIELRVYVEAAIDFPEEEVDFLAEGAVSERLSGIATRLAELQAGARQGSILRDGMNVVIAGQPNAGKSSLLNKLARREAAIVTNIPGTTRDVLRERISIDGMPLHIIDTAGLRESTDPVEQEGIRRAWVEIETADRVLLVTSHAGDLEEAEQELIQRLPSSLGLTIIRNKGDLRGENPGLQESAAGAEISLSAKTGAGIDLLTKHLKHTMGFIGTEQGLFTARRRHLNALAHAAIALEGAIEQMNTSRAGELIAEELRCAHEAMSEITGEFTSDDLLGEIFSSFCIGK